MPLDVLLAFVGVTTLLFLTPGPSMTLILANGAAHGVRAGIITVLGNAAGCAVLLAMVLGGLHLVVRHFEAWLPQFIDPGAQRLPQSVLLASVFIAVCVVVQTGLALAANRAGRWFFSGRGKLIDQIAAVVLIVGGLLLIIVKG